MRARRRTAEHRRQRRRGAAACSPGLSTDESRSAYYVRSAAGVIADSARSGRTRPPDAEPGVGSAISTGHPRSTGPGLAQTGQSRALCRASCSPGRTKGSCHVGG
eukprot:2082552-Alexandrium_andersonii.AAC.1